MDCLFCVFTAPSTVVLLHGCGSYTCIIIIGINDMANGHLLIRLSHQGWGLRLRTTVKDNIRVEFLFILPIEIG